MTKEINGRELIGKTIIDIDHNFDEIIIITSDLCRFKISSCETLHLELEEQSGEMILLDRLNELQEEHARFDEIKEHYQGRIDEDSLKISTLASENNKLNKRLARFEELIRQVK